MAGGEKAVLVVGGVTLDRIHLPSRAEPLEAPGGAGLYTARGAWESGGDCTLFAQKPDPFPEAFASLAGRPWIGPLISPAELPRLEIAHYGGGRAELLSADWGAQLRLAPDELPEDLSSFAWVHIAALGPTANQRRFAAACRARGAAAISAGTYGLVAHGEPEAVRALIAETDAFFMNENEAAGIFGGVDAVPDLPGKLIFVTLGAEGAVGVLDGRRVRIPAEPVEEANPTGAGDTFCGAVLAGLAAGMGLEEAMRQGVRLATARVAAVAATS